MPSDRELKLRIKTTRSLGQLTKAMKLVASAQLRKVETRSRVAKPYIKRLQETVCELAAQAGEASNIYMQAHQRGTPRVAVIVVASDNGLCGAYNTTLFKFIENDLAKKAIKPYRFVTIGKKAFRYFGKRGYDISWHNESKWVADYKLSKELFETARISFEKEQIDEVLIYYTESISMVKSKPRCLQLLPVKASALQNDERESAPAKMVDFIYEPSAKEALDIIIPNYLRAIVHQVLLESKTSELAARLTAMTNATDSADELVAELTLQYYRIRQTNITTEIIEIASSAEAQKR